MSILEQESGIHGTVSSHAFGRFKHQICSAYVLQRLAERAERAIIEFSAMSLVHSEEHRACMQFLLSYR